MEKSEKSDRKYVHAFQVSFIIYANIQLAKVNKMAQVQIQSERGLQSLRHSMRIEEDH